MQLRIDEFTTLEYNHAHDQVDIMVDVDQVGEAHKCASSLTKDDVIGVIAFLSECLVGGNIK
ncbi:hypothetical protein OAF54_00980 [bacterium]|nr:hypothetical protein [bacterium]